MGYRDPEKKRQYSKDYYEKNREAILAKNRREYVANRDARLAYSENYRQTQTEKYLWSSAKTRANKQGVPFSIEPEDIVIPDVCPALGIPIAVSNKGQRNSSPSLDRIINEKGYVPGNVHVISYRANRIKNDATLSELVALVDYLSRCTPT